MAGEPGCQVCAAKAANGWNTTGLVHCSKCCAIWTGRTRAHCTLCHQTFNSNGAADLHWVGGHEHPVNCPALELRSGIWYTISDWNPAEVFGDRLSR